MLNKQITDTRAWTADTIDAPSEWYYTLSERYLSALDSEVRKADAIFDLRVSDAIAHAPCLQPVSEALHTGRGFAIIEHLPVAHYTRDQARAAYWMIGQCLGVPFEQNIEGTLLYDVRDTGRDVKSGARFP